MVSTPRRRAQSAGSDNSLPSTTLPATPDKEQPWAYLRTTRLANLYRHMNACPACSAPDGLFTDTGPCLDALRLAALVDEAEDACRAADERHVWAATSRTSRRR